MRQALRGWAILAVLPAALAAQAPRDQDPQTPVFRSEIESVDVDVVVTDRKGNFVRGLSAEDFEILEDETPQEVATFSFVDLPLPGQRRDADRVAAETAIDEGRRFIMVLNAHGPRLAKIANQFVDEALGPGDQMSVYYTNPVNRAFVEGQSLTASKPRLRSAIRKIEPAFFDFAPPIFGTAAELREYYEHLEIEKYEMLQAAIERVSEAPGRRKAVLWFGAVPFNWGRSRLDDTSTAVAIAYRDVIRAANRHHVAIYPIDPVGLTTRRGARELMRMGALRALAEDTGVEAIVGTNDYERGYARIVREMSTYYLLTYYPNIVHRDGRFHTIQVRVGRPGVNVRARRGYYAPDAAAPDARRTAAPTPIERAFTELAEPLRKPTASGIVLWRRGPLPRDAYARTSVAQFSRHDRLRLDVPAAASAASARLLDRNGAALRVTLPVTERTDESNGSRWFVVDLTLSSFAQGAYAIELIQDDHVSHVAFRVVP